MIYSGGGIAQCGADLSGVDRDGAGAGAAVARTERPLEVCVRNSGSDVDP